MWDLLVVETNRYAAQSRSSQTSSRPRPWHDVTKEEMKAFVGMLMAMGICRLPRIEDYWCTTHPHMTPQLSKVMSLVRFQQICHYLHLADSSAQVPHGQPGYDPLFKVRKYLDLITPKLESEYNPHEHLTIDEAMIPFKGRLGFKQYMKDKPTKWGVKVFVLSDATNGYVHRLQVYTGKNSELSTHEQGLSTRVVLELLQGMESAQHKVYMDNYYTSPRLFLSLYDKKVGACGTVRTNCKYYPKDLVVSPSSVERGYMDHRCSPPLAACVWKDKRIISFLSNMHEATGPATVQRTTVSEGAVTREEVTCPPVLPDYQAFMRGVDRGDQLIKYYNIGRRSKNWWKRVFSYMIEVASLNAYIIQKDGMPPSERSKHDYLKFRYALMEELIGSYSSRARVAGRPHSLEHQQALRLDVTKSHLPIVGGPKRECVVCTKAREVAGQKRGKGTRHESRIRCSVCNVHLCCNKDRQCFYKYHTLVRYWE